MSNININLKGFDKKVYEAWKKGAFSWHNGIKGNPPIQKNLEIEITLEKDCQLKLKI